MMAGFKWSGEATDNFQWFTAREQLMPLMSAYQYDAVEFFGYILNKNEYLRNIILNGFNQLNIESN